MEQNKKLIAELDGQISDLKNQLYTLVDERNALALIVAQHESEFKIGDLVKDGVRSKKIFKITTVNRVANVYGRLILKSGELGKIESRIYSPVKVEGK